MLHSVYCSHTSLLPTFPSWGTWYHQHHHHHHRYLTNKYISNVHFSSSSEACDYRLQACTIFCELWLACWVPFPSSYLKINFSQICLLDELLDFFHYFCRNWMFQLSLFHRMPRELKLSSSSCFHCQSFIASLHKPASFVDWSFHDTFSMCLMNLIS
jgi:hypothetical protein